MNNQENSSPCLLVAYVIAACVGNSWTQPVLPSGYNYDPPSGSTSTPCYCSWSCYNLMMACTYCQSSNGTEDLLTWPYFIQNCQTSYTDEYFPSGYTLLANETIPSWAALNPTNWTGQVWTYAQAYSNHQLGIADSVPSVSAVSTGSTGSTGSHSSDLGAIVGGTVGGAAFLLLLALGIYICKRRRYRRARTTPVVDVNKRLHPSWQMHNRQLSDQSTASVLQQSTLSPMTYYTGSTTRTVPSLNSSFPPTSFTSGTDPNSYNTSGAQPRAPIPII
ncbi:hypothetical protein F5141DRAFT_1079014 [Pisolithus sp. B1]|nr:hypothetical protein F5141DRAFT_1079014 [Pisolithus sp. B1]